MIIISDIHGCFKTLMALIEKLPKDDKLAFAGDLIDRGPNSKAVIQYAIDNEIPTILGNHEQMLLNKDYLVWKSNGGDKMMESYGCKNYSNFLEVAKDHISWLSKLPYYLEFKDIKRNDGRHLMITHAALRGTIEEKDGTNELLWNRLAAIDNPELFNVFGHTPQPNVLIKKHYALIDTGCPFGYKLSALQFPSMKIWTQETIDYDKNE